MHQWVSKKTVNIEKANYMIKDAINFNRLSNNGKYVNTLQDELYDILKIDKYSKDIICVCSATAGIHAVIDSFNMKFGRKTKWCTQAFTFPSSAQNVLQDVTIVDVDNGGGLDLQSVPNDVDGIIVTNIFGNCVDIDKYENWCKTYNKILLFDNAATPYTFYKGINTCNSGDASVISFHHTKPIGFGEGGAIIINKHLSSNVKRVINFGFDSNYEWSIFGSNYKMSEISAIYILQFLRDNFENIVTHNSNLYVKIQEIIANSNISMYPNHGDKTLISCFCFLHKKFTPDNIALLSSVECKKYYKPLVKLPNSTNLYNEILCYPCNSSVTCIDTVYNDINFIIELK